MCEYDLFELGEGSYGRVYKGTHRLSGEIVAIKMVTSGFCDDFAGITPTEYDILFRIDHPNIASAIENVTKEQINPCLPMDNYATGIIMPLADSDASKTFPPTLDPLYACWQAASGLEALHASGYYHFDIKPVNCLLYGNVLKLADFGLAVDKATKYGNRLIVTLTHRPPEVTNGIKYELTEHIDVFSLGVLFNDFTIKGRKQGGYNDPDYITQNINSIHQKCLTIKEAASTQETYDLTGFGYFLNSSIVISFCDMIIKMTDYDPSKRGTAKEAREAIESIMDVIPTYHEPQMKMPKNNNINYMNMNIQIIEVIRKYMLEKVYTHAARIFFTFFDLYSKFGFDDISIAVCCLSIAADIHMFNCDEYFVFRYLQGEGILTSPEASILIDQSCGNRDNIEQSPKIQSFFNTPNVYDTCRDLDEIKKYFYDIEALKKRYKETSGLFTRMYNHTFLISDLKV